MKLDIPKNTWISDISLDFFRDGFWASALGLNVTFAGNICPGIDFISEVIEPLGKLTLPKRKIVRFKGFYYPTDPLMTVAVKAFKSWGFMTQAIIRPENSAEWIEKLDWTILRVEKPFVPFATNELWYCPPAQDTLPEPRLPPKDMLLYVNKGYSTAATLKFITESDRNWNLL